MQMIFIYGKNGFDPRVLTLHNGPIGRTLFTQVGTWRWHFHSCPGILHPLEADGSRLPNCDEYFAIRSVRVKWLWISTVPRRFTHRELGATNTLFIGEAYSPISIISAWYFILYVAAFIALFVFVFFEAAKNPFNIAVFAFLTSRFAQITKAGSADFIYNFQFLLVFLLVLAVNLFPKIWNKHIGPRISGRSKVKLSKIQIRMRLSLILILENLNLALPSALK